MTADQALSVFSSLSPREKEEFIAHLMSELTIIGRDTYEVGQDGLTDPQRLRRVNEVQHRVSEYLWALLRDDQQRYPDDVLLKIILEHPDDSELEQQLHEVFGRLTMHRRLSVA